MLDDIVFFFKKYGDIFDFREGVKKRTRNYPFLQSHSSIKIRDNEAIIF